jgi:prepilin-type N-terminal cleavage/methylation domain-containing protein
MVSQLHAAQRTDQGCASKVMNLNRRQAFSLIELMLAIAIAGILMALAMPEYQKLVARACSVACLNNLRQIGIAVGAYLADNDNTFPSRIRCGLRSKADVDRARSVRRDAANPEMP